MLLTTKTISGQEIVHEHRIRSVQIIVSATMFTQHVRNDERFSLDRSKDIFRINVSCCNKFGHIHDIFFVYLNLSINRSKTVLCFGIFFLHIH